MGGICSKIVLDIRPFSSIQASQQHPLHLFNSLVLLGRLVGVILLLRSMLGGELLLRWWEGSLGRWALVTDRLLRGRGALVASRLLGRRRLLLGRGRNMHALLLGLVSLSDRSLGKTSLDFVILLDKGTAWAPISGTAIAHATALYTESFTDLTALHHRETVRG